ncbi:MAG: 4Fe-4S binding protein [Deltaproteobacteria bacterium]|nr:4Fe-4S binding protein [Deltaproteobacteria bacterium]
MAVKGYVEIDVEGCKGCELCVVNCPTDVLALNMKDTNSYGLHYAVMVAEERCTGCMNCAVVCPDACITVYREIRRKAG